jgi:hypothetical protein
MLAGVSRETLKVALSIGPRSPAVLKRPSPSVSSFASMFHRKRFWIPAFAGMTELVLLLT